MQVLQYLAKHGSSAYDLSSSLDFTCKPLPMLTDWPLRLLNVVLSLHLGYINYLKSEVFTAPGFEMFCCTHHAITPRNKSTGKPTQTNALVLFAQPYLKEFGGI